MIIPILILVSSVLFLAGFLNPIKKLLLQPKKLFSSSPTPPLQQISPPTNYKRKDEDLKRVFDTFDKNGDGFITRQELKESLNNIGIFVPLKEVEEMVENLDLNKDGLVDVGEFTELFELLRGKDTKNIEKGKRVFDDDDDDNDEVGLKEAFDVFDGDKDGLITVKELGLVLSSLGLKEGRREEDCKEMIKKVDVDGDGMVNFDEFKMMMRTSCASSTLVPAL